MELVIGLSMGIRALDDRVGLQYGAKGLLEERRQIILKDGPVEHRVRVMAKIQETLDAMDALLAAMKDAVKGAVPDWSEIMENRNRNSLWTPGEPERYGSKETWEAWVAWNAALPVEELVCKWLNAELFLEYGSIGRSDINYAYGLEEAMDRALSDGKIPNNAGIYVVFAENRVSLAKEMVEMELAISDDEIRVNEAAGAAAHAVLADKEARGEKTIAHPDEIREMMAKMFPAVAALPAAKEHRFCPLVSVKDEMGDAPHNPEIQVLGAVMAVKKLLDDAGAAAVSKIGGENGG